MPQPLPILAGLLAWATALALPAGAAARTTSPAEDDPLVDRIVAVVNTEPVTLFELRRAAAPYLALERRREDASESFETRARKVVKEALDNLVNDILVYGVAKDMAISVGPEKIDAHIKKIADDNRWTEDELAEQLKRVGFASIADYRRHAEREMIKSQVLSIKVMSRVRVDERDVDARYQREIGTRGKVEERRAAHILLLLDEAATAEQEAEAKATLERARQDIAEGIATFNELARRISQDGNRNSGGDLGWFQQGDFDPSFDNVIFSMREGELSVPFRSRFGVHLAVVTGIRERELSSAEDIETAKRRIRMEMREAELERVYNQWLRGLRSEAFVRIRAEDLI